MKSKTTAVVLAFFLGGFGAHRFYLGQSGRGILYLVFCWTLIPAIIAFIDFFCLLLMSEDEFNRKYNCMMVPQQVPVANAVNTVAINMGNASEPRSNSDEIKKLYELKEKGIITQEEFDLKKKTIL